MAVLDFVLPIRALPGFDSLPPAARTVPIRVPDDLDPYRQQQLRDALAAEFARVQEAIAPSSVSRASGKDDDENATSPQEAVKTSLSELQTALQRAADRWLAARVQSTPPPAPRSSDIATLMDQAARQMREFAPLAEQAGSHLTNRDRKSGDGELERFAAALQEQLGILARSLDALLDVADGDHATEREQLVQQLVETIPAGHTLVTKLGGGD